MDTEARKRAEAAFEKRELKRVEASSAWAEYQGKRTAIDKNTERLTALRLARDAQVVIALPPPEKSKPKVRRGH